MKIVRIPPVALLLLALFQVATSYKIMVFSPLISRSHMISNARIADTLAKAGHDVTLFEPDIYSRNETLISAKYAKIWKLDGFSDALQTYGRFSPFDEQSLLQVKSIFDGFNLGQNIFCEELINMDVVMETMKREKYDAFFVEQLNFCGHAIAYQLKVPVRFLISSCPLSEYVAYTMGIPIPTSYVAALYTEDFGSHPTYWQRVRNMAAYAIFVYTGKTASADLDRRLRKKFGSDFPSVEEIVADSDLLFIATEKFIDLPRPGIPNMVHIAGLGVEEKTLKPLDEEFASEMSKGEEGVVFFSMGTMANTTTAPSFFMEAFANLIRKHPRIHFIIKIDRHDQVTPQMVKGLTNVHVTSWAPQPEILNHERLRFFITHAGYNGLIEAARAGVPLLCIPLLFDQPKNSFSVEENGWGLRVNRFTLRDEPHLLEAAFNEMLTNPIYKDGAKRISKLLKTKPFQAEELLVKYTDFAIRNGGLKELRIEGRHLNFFVYHNLDIIVPFAFVVLFVVYVLLKSLISLCSSNDYVKSKHE